MFESDRSVLIFFAMVFTMFILFGDEPDLMDGITVYLSECDVQKEE